MATALFLSGLRHPVRTLRTRWSKDATGVADRPDTMQRVAGDGARVQSADRLERIAAYARSGYFDVEYTAGMFVVPFEMPPQ